MPAESFRSGEAKGWVRWYYRAGLIAGLVVIIASLAVGRPIGSLFGVVIGVLSTMRYLSIRGKGIDPSKSTIQRVRNREFRKYGSPF
jgi:hypothetical protein